MFQNVIPWPFLCVLTISQMFLMENILKQRLIIGTIADSNKLLVLVLFFNKSKLQQHGPVVYDKTNKHCHALANGTKCDRKIEYLETLYKNNAISSYSSVASPIRSFQVIDVRD